MPCGPGELQCHEYCRHVYLGEREQTLDAEARLRIPKEAIVIVDQAIELKFECEKG